jgi:hypothetical protein
VAIFVPRRGTPSERASPDAHANLVLLRDFLDGMRLAR